MKNIKKILALVIAMAMIVGTMSTVFGATVGELTLDNAISVSGLETGDKVDFFQVLEFDQNSATTGKTGGWKAATGFTGLTETEIQTMLALDSDGKPVTITEDNKDSYGISAELAAKIADWAESAQAKYADVAETSGTATQSNPVAGLYVGIVKPGKVGFVYNPVFVGADYVNNSTNTVEAVITDSYSPASMAKKAELDLEKTAEDKTRTIDANKAETVNAGDDIEFTVKTTIPEFGDNYTSPVFKVSDVLSTGLKLDKESIKVYPTKDAITDSTTALTLDDYELNPAATDNTFTVNFKTNYIKGLSANQPITITYKAKITSTADFSINVLDNTVTVNYSNKPTDTEGHGIIKDKTNHYTFDIDANLLGEAVDSWKTTEVVKVRVDASGKEITETVELHGSDQKVGALEGAEFALYTDAACTVPYTNDILTAGKKIVSDGTGRLTIQGEEKPGIRGLDAGTYYLKETKAPAGYIASQTATTIEIIPTIAEKTYTETQTIDGVETTITYKANELSKYEVKVNGKTTADYTITNQGDGTWKSDKHDTYTGANGLIGEDGKDAEKTPVGKIVNTQGTALPSTGGVGTTMMYMFGAIFVMIAGVLLVSKRRMSVR